ncbi:MAG: hypothetical protein U0165_07095 [Polyangiaceae bacterium]
MNTDHMLRSSNPGFSSHTFVELGQRHKRKLAGVAGLALALSVLGGCSSHSQPPSAASPASSNAAQTKTPESTGTIVPPLANAVPVVGATDVAGLVERLKPAVVNITTTRQLVKSEGLPFGHPFFGGGEGPRDRRIHWGQALSSTPRVMW